METESKDSSITTYIVIGLILIGAIFWGNSGTTPDYSEEYSDYAEEQTIDSYDAKLDYWDDISEYLDGTHTIEACSDSSGNCYDVDAEISSGDIQMIYFANGGYLDIYGGDVDYDGTASGDSDDDYWSFQVSDSDIDEAVQDWADYNDYTLE